jgi:hypothetical protein
MTRSWWWGWGWGWWWGWWKSSNLAVTRLCKVYLRQVYWQPERICSTSLAAALCRDVNILYSHSRSNQIRWGGRRLPFTLGVFRSAVNRFSEQVKALLSFIRPAITPVILRHAVDWGYKP